MGTCPPAGDGSWAVISCTHEPLNNTSPWERQRRTTISRPTGATAAPTPLPESGDTHKNLERKALPNTSFSGEEAADLRDLCRRAGTSPVPLLPLLDPPRFCPHRPPAPLHTNHTGKHTSGVTDLMRFQFYFNYLGFFPRKIL